MLRRHRQIRMQIHQLMDACLFALSYWLAFLLRSNPDVIDLFGLDPAVNSFKGYVWLYLILIPAAPLVLEAQGFYNRPILCSRRTTVLLLFRGCLVITLGLVVALFFAPRGLTTDFARSVVLCFGGISFSLVL